MSITYIDKDYEKYVCKIPTGPIEEDINESIKIVEINEGNDDIINEENVEDYKIIKSYINNLNKNRSKHYNDWLEILMIITNIGQSSNWTNSQILELSHEFSKTSPGFYDYKSVDKKIKNLCFNDTKCKYKVGKKKLLLRLKEDNLKFYDDNIIPSYDEMKIDFEKNVIVINNPLCFYRIPLLPRIITEETSNNDFNQQLTEAKLITMYKNKSCNIYKKGKGKEKAELTEIKFINHWLLDKHRLTYEGLIFSPGGLNETQKKYYKNLFEGFKADRIELKIDCDYTKIQPILNHMKMVFCNNDEDHYQYFLKWIAQTIKYPDKRPQVGLVFYSKEHGTGRNSFTNFLGKCIYGIDLFVTTRGTEKIFTKFNSILKNCMFLVIEEASGEIKKFMEDFKNLITEPYITLEQKGIDSCNCKNYVNPILLTNNINILDIDDKDRRFAILESSGCMKGNKEYFQKLHSCLEDTQSAALFIKYMREEVKCNWSTMEFQENRPITKAYRKQIALNTKNYIKYISHIVNEDNVFINDKKHKYQKYNGKITFCIKEKDLYTDYAKVCLAYKYTSYPFDTFIQNITTTSSGIIKIVKNRFKCLLFNKDEILVWVANYRNEIDEPIIIYDPDLEEELIIEPIEFLDDSDEEITN